MNFTKKLRSWALERKFGRTVLFFTGVLLLTMCSFSLPQPGPPFSEDVDSSLGAVLHFASEHRLQFGQDLVFTYGPLGFLTFFYYFPHAFAGQLATHFVLGFVAAAGVCLIAMRSPKIWRWLLLLTFCWVGANGSPRVDLSLNLGLFCWCLLCFVETGNRLAISALVFVVLGVFAALTKISFLFAA